ncbi:MAG: hypothetical protein EOP09_16280, partial [Proteobacteria bacterium]
MLALHSCGSSRSNTRIVNPQLETETCQFGPDDGGPSPRLMPLDEFKQGPFGKSYRGSWLGALLATSINETLSFLRRIPRLQLFQAESSGPSQ